MIQVARRPRLHHTGHWYQFERDFHSDTWPRAAIALCSRFCYQQNSKQQEARGLLAQIYDSFTEGFDTVDLREAKALLDELS